MKVWIFSVRDDTLWSYGVPVCLLKNEGNSILGSWLCTSVHWQCGCRLRKNRGTYKLSFRCLRLHKVERSKIKLKKWVISVPTVKLLGYTISENGVEADTQKIKCILGARLLQSKKKLRLILKRCYSNRRVVEWFSRSTAPQNELRTEQSDYIRERAPQNFFFSL